MSLTARVLAGLVAGFALGLVVSGSDATWLRAIPGFLDPVGAIWVNGIRMTVIPLVVSSLIAAVAGAPDPRTIGRIGVRAFAAFVLVVLAAGIVSAIVGPPLVALLAVDPAAAAALRASAEAAGGTAAHVVPPPTLAQWLVSLVPANPDAAASEGALLPLIVAALAFGAATARIASDSRQALVHVIASVRDASIVLVRWMLLVAPIGVFALAAGLSARLGVGALGAVAGYVALVCGVSAAFSLLVLYPLAVFGGRVDLRAFARAALPAQAVAFSSRSSMAALPAMVESTGRTLKLGDEISGFFIPLAASTFRAGGAVGQIIGALFLARLYGIDVGATALAAMVLTTVLTCFSVPGIPGGAIITMVPVLLAAGIPVEGIGILLGVDTIPDMFRTTTNVTGDLAVATVLAPRRGPSAAGDSATTATG